MTWIPQTLRTRVKGGSRRRNNLGSGWQLVHRPEGWLVLSRPFPLPSGAYPLEMHADWTGSVKLVTLHDRSEQRAEFFLGRLDSGADDPQLDPELAGALDTLTQELAALPSCGNAEAVAGWLPPPASTLAGWLTAAGRETVIDREENLRLVLRRSGCDGQVRIERGQGRLRFVLPLGSWSDLEPASLRAMRELASAVNAQIRLARIAWFASDHGGRCEAQVDLSGLPLPAPEQPWYESLWVHSVGLAVRALEIALRQLGLELPVLADARYLDLAERLAGKE